MKIENENDRSTVVAKIMALNLSAKPWEVSAKPHVANRSLAQNRLSFKWYAERNAVTGNGNEYERNWCKWFYGCPIVGAADDSDFSEFYSILINTYTWEQCVKAMGFIQVTSLMTTKQMAEYLTVVEVSSAEQDIYLTRPDELYWEAMGIKK